MPDLGFPIAAIAVVILIIYVLSSIKILSEYERGVIFRLGRLMGTRRAPASSWSSRRLTALCASRCGRKRSKFLRRTSLPAITSR